MELIHYLDTYLLSKEALLRAANVTEQQLRDYQQQGVMPQCSYRLHLSVQCDSFFGLHSEEKEVEYYARGYVSWLVTISTLQGREPVYSTFVRRYKQGLGQLKEQGHGSNSPKLNAELDQHLAQEWQHFLAGTYGLCTRSGLPEDIAAKELAILEITELTAEAELLPQQLQRLSRAVNLLDAASAWFAPHERAMSSRHRLVDEVRGKYKLD